MKKVAIITGSSRGIGRACAEKLAEDGFNIVINYNNNHNSALETCEKIKKMGVDCICVQADVSISSEAARLINDTVKHFGRLDVLINNAGIVHNSFLLMTSDQAIDDVIAVNLKSYLYCSRQAALKMFATGGKIINISSVSAEKSTEGQVLYSATKGAVNSLTRVMAKELANRKINVNAVAPGFINTEMLDGLSLKEKIVEMIPMNRFGESFEVAELVSFLCSEKSNYITGQIFTIDGGLSI